jgi:tyrosinase
VIGTFTDLTPFWKAPTTFWASTTVRDFGNALNYTYPDFHAQADTVSAAAVSSPAQALFAQPAAPQAAVAQAAVAAPGHSAGDSAAVTHWTARIRFKQYEIGDSFSVLLYLNAVPTNPEEYYTSPNYVGAYHGFVNTASEHCTNCQNQAETGVEGYVHINDAILQHAHQTSLDPAVVVPYLTKNLHWRVVKVSVLSYLVGFHWRFYLCCNFF